MLCVFASWIRNRSWNYCGYMMRYLVNQANLSTGLDTVHISIVYTPPSCTSSEGKHLHAIINHRQQPPPLFLLPRKVQAVSPATCTHDHPPTRTTTATVIYRARRGNINRPRSRPEVD